MNRGYIRGHAERDPLSGANGPIRFVAATEGIKRDGIDLRMAGAELDRFRSNPVILFGHNAWGRQNLPIGRAENVEVEGGALKMDVVFDKDDDFALTVERKIRSGFLNAVSIGFDVRAWEKPGQSMWNGGVATKWELFETSVVPVPMDEKATVEGGRAWGYDAKSDMIPADQIRDYINEQVEERFARLCLNKEVQAQTVDRVDADRVLASLMFGGDTK